MQMLVSGLGFQLELTPGSRQPYLASVTRRRWRNYVVGTSIRLACVGLDWARACPSTDSTASRRLKLQGHASTSRQPANASSTVRRSPQGIRRGLSTELHQSQRLKLPGLHSTYLFVCLASARATGRSTTEEALFLWGE